MAKKNSLYFCKECGFEATGWMGKCPACGQWNTFVSAPSDSQSKKVTGSTVTSISKSWVSDSSLAPVPLSGTSKEVTNGLSTGNTELDRLFGGRITNGSVTLIGGEPGIGKSTILLQLADSYCGKGSVLYVSGEESAPQIGSRATRLGISNDRILIYAQTSFESIASQIEQVKPALCIIDSIQTLYSENIQGTPGSVTQAREVTAGLVRIAKDSGIPIILVGHVTKDGNIAGPKTLEHMVDTVLYFEGDCLGNYRILRSVKNRFGRSSELVFLEMTGKGLIPVDNASAMLIKGRPMNAPGSSLTSVLEGTKSLLIEIQALVADSCYSTPQRMTNGLDRNRVTMLLAVCEKFLNLAIGSKDCFINVIGGLRLDDTSSDLAIVAAIVSSFREIPIRENTVILGEIGLSGEIRNVTRVKDRLSEAKALGIKTVVLPGSCRDVVAKINEEDDKIFSNNVNNLSRTCGNMHLFDFVFVDNLLEAVDVLFSD